MVEKQRSCDHLLLLVGSNPYPNFLTALIFEPQSIWLFYSPETEEVKNYIKESLETKFKGISLDERCIVDATDAARVRAAFFPVPLGCHLHYTGGTKIMAAHARMAFKDAEGKDEHASYLDERKGVLRFDDGYEIDLSKQHLKLTIGDVLKLHGIEHTTEGKSFNSLPTAKDAKEIATLVLANPCLASVLYNIHKKDGKRCSISEAKQNPAVLFDLLGVDLSIPRLPEDCWTKGTYEKWCKFLGGGWLEIWCRDLVRGLQNKIEVSSGINCLLANGRSFEIDLAVVRSHRIFVISCTTDIGIKTCKSKLFEVALRARQLGGDLARSALVCLLNGGDSKGLYVKQLQNDVEAIWDAPNTPCVFGLDDLKEWAGISAEPNTDTLKEWLDS